MPKELQPAVIAQSVRSIGVTFASELRGDPPELELVMIHHYELVDSHGNVVGTKHDGKDVPADLLSAIEQLITAQTAEARTAEGL